MVQKRSSNPLYFSEHLRARSINTEQSAEQRTESLIFQVELSTVSGFEVSDEVEDWIEWTLNVTGPKSWLGIASEGKPENSSNVRR